MSTTYHVPVLFDAALEGLDLQPAGTYVDCTFGGGGHSRGILDALGPDGRLFGLIAIQMQSPMSPKTVGSH